MTRQHSDITGEDITIREGSTDNQLPVGLLYSYSSTGSDNGEVDAVVTWDGYRLSNIPPKTPLHVIQDWIRDKFPAPDSTEIDCRNGADPFDRETIPYSEWRKNPAFSFRCNTASISEVARVEWREDNLEWVIDCADNPDITALLAE